MFPVLIDTTILGYHLFVPTFHVILALAATLLFFLFFLQNSEARKKPLAFLVFFSVVFFAAVVFARFGEIFIEMAAGVHQDRSFNAVSAVSGATVTTGLLGVILVIFLWALWDPHRIVTWNVLDTLAVSFPFAHALGRVGCLLNGCCYGDVCNPSFPFALTYPDTWIAKAWNPSLVSGPRYPSPLLEFAGLLVLGLVLLFLLRRSKKSGLVVAVYALGYAVIRFLVELTRGDTVRGTFFGLPTGQWFSLALFSLGIVFLVVYFFRANKPDTTLRGFPVSKHDAFSGEKA